MTIGQATQASATFVGPRQPIRLLAPAKIIAQVRRLAPDWPSSQASRNPDDDVVLNVHECAEGWRIDGPECITPEQVYQAGYELANGAVGAISACYLAQDPELLCLHAAAVTGVDGLTVLLGQNFAGKSTLAATLAARGLPLFCDDRLLVGWADPPRARALGVASKLRLPLPPGADQLLATFVEQTAIWRTLQFAILDAPGEARARFGDTRYLANLVLLDRRDAATAPTLAHLPRPQAVRALLQHHFAPHLSTDTLLRACTAIAAAVPAWSLSYSDLEEGATAIRHGLEHNPRRGTDA